MSIEKALADLTVAVAANTEALKALGGASAGKSASGTSDDKKPETKTKPPAETKTKPAGLERGQVNAALTEVKEKKGAPAAKAIIKDVGGVDKMADIPEDKFQEVFDAAKNAVKEEEETI